MTMIFLECGDAKAEISVLGAELRAWSVGGRALLWGGDPVWWPQISPVLFPVIGRTNGDVIRVDGKHYPMPQHGFAASCVFAIEQQAADHVRLILTDDAQTRTHYPFPFLAALEYRLSGAGLSILFEVTNPGTGALPYSCGLHPGFHWDWASGNPEREAVIFEKPEAATVPVIMSSGLFTRQPRPIPLTGSRLPLVPELFAQNALCFLDLASSALRFETSDGASITMRTDDFPHYALWTRQGAPFLCLEAWTGYGDYTDFQGDITQKPGIRLLAPGAVARHTAVFGFETRVS